jgi:hypothetical protein
MTIQRIFRNPHPDVPFSGSDLSVRIEPRLLSGHLPFSSKRQVTFWTRIMTEILAEITQYY